MNKGIYVMVSCLMANAAFCTPVDLEGGEVVNPATGKGWVSVVSAQNKVDFGEIQKVAENLSEASECHVVAEASEIVDPIAAKASSSAAVIVLVVDNATSPTMLLAPEDHWGVVNVGRLTDDLHSESAKAKFLVSRARKEVIRAFSILCGGGSSQFEGNVMNAPSIRAADHMSESIPVDMVDHWQRHLKTLGVTRRECASYLQACQEGWAPKPVNDIQRKIWNEIHATPTNPLKITFDPKTDTK